MKWVLALVLALAATHASAFDAKQLAKFKATNSCEKCDLSKANLKWAKLRGANLSGANLKDANLSGADLSKAKMKKALTTLEEAAAAAPAPVPVPVAPRAVPRDFGAEPSSVQKAFLQELEEMIRIEQEQIAAPRFRITSFDGKTPARFCRRSLEGVVRYYIII